MTTSGASAESFGRTPDQVKWIPGFIRGRADGVGGQGRIRYLRRCSSPDVGIESLEYTSGVKRPRQVPPRGSVPKWTDTNGPSAVKQHVWKAPARQAHFVGALPPQRRPRGQRWSSARPSMSPT